MVDDNDAIIHVMTRLLQRQGYSVSSARSGREAVEKISSNHFDLAIIDLNLPDMNGMDVYEIFSVRSPATKKLILTGLPPDKTELSSGPQKIDVLVKPLTAEELIGAVRNKLADAKPS